MLKKNVIRFVTGILCLFALAGCGNSGDSHTNGSLVLTVTATNDTGGRWDVSSSAVFTVGPSTSTTTTAPVLQGVPVTIVTTISSLTGTPQVKTDNVFTDATGKTPPVKYFIPQTTENIFVDVVATASGGGLSDRKTVTVPHL